MKILILVSFALVATFVQADFPTADEVSLAKQVRICLDMGSDEKTCFAKFAEQIAKFDPVHFKSVVNYEAVLKEMNEFFEFYNQGHNIRESLALLEQKHAAQRQKRAVPSVSDIKNAAETHLTDIKNGAEAALTDAKNAAAAYKAQIDTCVKTTGKNMFSCAFDLFGAKAGAVLNEIKASLTEKFGRNKRQVASQKEVAWAKAIKICLDMGTSKDACYDKILGANKDKVDLAKLQNIGKYEDVLKELRQFLSIYNKGGHTIRETMVLLHKQQVKPKTRAGSIPQNVQDLVDLKTVILECMAAWPNKDVTKCAVAVFGTQIEGSSQLKLVIQLVNNPQVQEFAKGAGQALHAYMESMTGLIAQIHGWAHSAYDYLVSFG